MTKNLKGGYKIVSLKGNDLTSESAFIIKGIYEELRDSYSKPILVTDIVIDDEKQQDAYAVVKKTDFGYTIDVYGYALTVTDEDTVTSVALPEITSIGDGLTLEDGELSTSGGVDSIGGVSGAITLGSGLAITEEGELSASGGGKTLYQHFIKMSQFSSNYGAYCGITIVNDSPNALDTYDKIKAYINNTSDVITMYGGYYSTQTNQGGPVVAGKFDSTLAVKYYDLFSAHTVVDVSITPSSVVDVIKEL